MAYDYILVDVDEGVGTITLNRPEKLNAISNELRAELESALRALNPGDAVRVIRLKANGRAFCAGYDLTPARRPPEAREELDYLQQPSDGPRGTNAWDLGESRIAVDRESLRESVHRWLWMWSYRKPIIAQVHGYCLAGGNEMIGACDIIIAAEDAQFGHPASRALGIPPTLGFWPARIGAQKTKELLFTGDSITGREAEGIGMVNRAVPAEELDDVTMAFCRRVAQTPLDLLSVHKHATNRWLELQGIRTALFEGAEFDAIAHEAHAAAEFNRIARESGLNSALSWRDSPFR